MSCSTVTVKILYCLVILCAVFVSTTHGRSLERIRHKNNVQSKTLAEIEEDLRTIEEFERNLPVRHSRTRPSRHRVTSSKKLQDNYEELSEDNSLDKFHAIKKRHNGAGEDVAYEIMSTDEESDYQENRARSIHHRAVLDKLRNKHYEVEVKEAQNSSLCNYTVVDIPDPSPDKSRIPKNLFNVMCNHAGSRCRDTGTYCCTQTYSKIEVRYGDGTREIIKIYTGCVCSLRLYGKLKPYKPLVPIND